MIHARRSRKQVCNRTRRGIAKRFLAQHRVPFQKEPLRRQGHGSQASGVQIWLCSSTGQDCQTKARSYEGNDRLGVTRTEYALRTNTGWLEQSFKFTSGLPGRPVRDVRLVEQILGLKKGLPALCVYGWQNRNHFVSEQRDGPRRSKRDPSGHDGNVYGPLSERLYRIEGNVERDLYFDRQSGRSDPAQEVGKPFVTAQGRRTYSNQVNVRRGAAASVPFRLVEFLQVPRSYFE